MREPNRHESGRLSEAPPLEPLGRRKGPARAQGSAAAGALYRGVAIGLGDRARTRASRRRAGLGAGVLLASLAVASAVSPLGRPLRGMAGEALEALHLGQAEVLVRGNEYLAAADVVRAAGLAERVPFFRVDLGEASRRLESHPRLRSARATRRLDGKIVLRVEERRPVALLPLHRPVEVDGEGRLLPPLLDGAVADLPLVQGLAAPVHGRVRDADWGRAVAWMEALGAPSIRLLPRVSEIDVRDARATVLVLAPDGTRVLLPGERTDSRRLAALCIVLADLEEKRLAAETIDCRAARMVVVRPRAGPARERGRSNATPKTDRVS